MRAMLDQLMGTGRDGEEQMGVLVCSSCLCVVGKTSQEANKIAAVRYARRPSVLT